jgi:hypothetical protein
MDFGSRSTRDGGEKPVVWNYKSKNSQSLGGTI